MWTDKHKYPTMHSHYATYDDDDDDDDEDD
jgi:hypothetical protein